MCNGFKKQWRELYSQTLVDKADKENWPVFRDHCIARIIYDHVAGAKWNTVWDSPAIHNMGDHNLMTCIETAHALYQGELSPVTLNNQSLQYRNKKPRN